MMRIPSVRESDYATQQASGRRATSRTGETATFSTSVDGCSAILSAGARLHLEARRAFVRAAGEREQRVERLRQQLETGTYKVDTAGLCDSLLSISRKGGSDT